MTRAAITVTALLASIVIGFAIGRNWNPASGPVNQPAAENEREILYWVAPMDPDYRRDAPGKSPMGMDLVPVYATDSGPGVVSIDPLIVSNLDWTENLSALDFLRDIGKNFPINVMLGKDSVRSRLERTDSGLSYTEFSYMLLQAYDFVQLNQQFGCELQVGGSDQWGNITAGIDLARRMRGVQLYGLTLPLLARLPPNLLKMLRTLATVRVGLSVAVSTSTATPWGA